MNGKARSEPNNHVEWANKFKSNMPDWPTARKCAVVDIIQDQPGIAQWRVSEHIDQSRFNAILDRVQKVITLAEFGPPDQTLGQPDGIAKRHPLEGLIKFTEDNKRIIIDPRPPLPPPPGAKK